MDLKLLRFSKSVIFILSCERYQETWISQRPGGEPQSGAQVPVGRARITWHAILEHSSAVLTRILTLKKCLRFQAGARCMTRFLSPVGSRASWAAVVWRTAAGLGEFPRSCAWVGCPGRPCTCPGRKAHSDILHIMWWIPLFTLFETINVRRWRKERGANVPLWLEEL